MITALHIIAAAIKCQEQDHVANLIYVLHTIMFFLLTQPIII